SRRNARARTRGEPNRPPGRRRGCRRAGTGTGAANWNGVRGPSPSARRRTAAPAARTEPSARQTRRGTMGTSAARRRPARATTGRTVEPREIAGMTLVALGAFLFLVLLGGVNGGSAGTGLVDLTRALVGRAAVVAPFVLVGVGAALIVRIDLAGVLRFRIGVLVLSLASLLA